MTIAGDMPAYLGTVLRPGVDREEVVRSILDFLGDGNMINFLQEQDLPWREYLECLGQIRPTQTREEERPA